MSATLKEWITEAAAGEPVVGVVLGEMGWGDYGNEDVPDYAKCPKNKLMSWEEALPFLSYDFATGFGAPGCQAVHAWTEKRVIFVSQYDGSTCIESVPRNPQDCEPSMPGG